MQKETTLPQVLIVGAGPTGLMAACQLALLGIPFLIIEKNEHSTTQSRALGIQARTMEIFAQMGIAQEFVTQGVQTKAVNFIAGRRKRRLPIGEIGKGLSAFPYLLMHEQSKTELVLNRFLKKHQQEVHWSTELVSFTQNNDAVTAVIKNKKGEEKTIRVDYIIGADGAKSVVRHILGIPLEGATYHQLLYVLDCKVTSTDLKNDEVYVAISDKTFNAFFPLIGGMSRVIGVVPEELRTKDPITFEDIQKHFSERVAIPVTLSDPNWISIYHSHHRCVKHFQMGRAFLAGDAAHIHSPVGAQGMNTGLQDVYNLAWKIAFVLQRKAKPALLDTYTQERLPFAQRLVATTDRAFNLIVSGNIVKAVFTQHIIPAFLQFAIRTPRIRDFMFRTVSQIGISYKASALSQNATLGSFPTNAPRPGDRVPYVFYTDEKGNRVNVQEKVQGTTFLLILFTGDSEHNTKDAMAAVTEKWKESISTMVIAKKEETKAVYEAFGIANEGYYLIRPDMYIAYQSADFSVQPLQQYLENFLTNSSV